MRHRSRAVGRIAFPALIGVLLAAAAPPPNPQADVTVTITGLRSAKGQVLACLTTRADAFPDCGKDPLARKLKVQVPATAHPSGEMGIDFGIVPAGHYAVSLIHDENDDGRLDTALMIPREGYGFSRDAPVRMGPPRFKQAAFAVEGLDVHLTIKMRYLL